MLETRYVFEHGLRGERGPRLLRYLLAHGADEFSITVMALQDIAAPFADAFEDELAPFERPVPTGAVAASTPTRPARPVRLWTLNEASLARLLSFFDSGLFHSPAGPDGWLEDLTIYRQREPLLTVMSNEQVGLLRLTLDEHQEVAALDISSEVRAEGIDD